jgi:Flp pilus assembly protein TadG
MRSVGQYLRNLDFRRAVDGAMAVEFAAIAPFLLIMLLGVIEGASAISQSLAVQASARAGTDFGLTKPPVQGDMQPIVNAVKAAMPAEWVANSSSSDPTINASLFCECEVTGAVACSNECGTNEQKQTYLKVDVAKIYTPLVNFRFIKPSYRFSNSSQVRLN